MNLQPESSYRQETFAAATFCHHHQQQYLEVCPAAYQQVDHHQYLNDAISHHHHHNHSPSFGPNHHQVHHLQQSNAYTTNLDHANLGQGFSWGTMELVTPASASSSTSLLSPKQEQQNTSTAIQPIEAASTQAITSQNLEATLQQTPPEKIIQRVKANKKERRRTQSINQAFSELRRHIPDVPSDTKLSKIKTLRLAISYISHLMSTLDEDREESNKKNLNHGIATSTRQIQQQRVAPVVGLTTTNDNNRTRCERSCNRDRKHRTGWPEIVWKSIGNFKT